MRTKKLNKKGFTLVEVIVVAVIVAVLALVGIQLYQGYVADARQGTADNLASQVAGFITTEQNRGGAVAANTYAGGVEIPVTGLPSGVTATKFVVPGGAETVVTVGATDVFVTINGTKSKTVKTAVAP